MKIGYHLVKIASCRAKIDEENRFMEKLDRLLDILICKCAIKCCDEFGCSTICNRKVHIECTCSKEAKIPSMELAFIKAQLEKLGNVSSLQIGPTDFHETKRQRLHDERKESRKESKRKKLEKAQREEAELRRIS